MRTSSARGVQPTPTISTVAVLWSSDVRSKSPILCDSGHLVLPIACIPLSYLYWRIDLYNRYSNLEHRIALKRQESGFDKDIFCRGTDAQIGKSELGYEMAHSGAKEACG